MSARVDVLAVLQYHAIGLRDAPRLTREQAGRVAGELAKASAAVAELIDAAMGARDMCMLGPARDKLDAALARVGGAK